MDFFRQLYEHTPPWVWIVGGLMLFSMAVQGLYYLLIFRKMARYGGLQGNQEATPPVSVVICARNEASNLREHLPGFLEQDYPQFEVVVVNDCSTDNTDEILMDLKVKYAHLKITTINQDRKFSHGKKLALTVGIKAATYEHLLLTDADCKPASSTWARGMARHFSTEKTMVLGIGKYEKRPGLLNILVRYETLFTAMQYISFALRGRPFMGVGRNLAYTKKMFFDNKGFASHLKIQSGDDDLFVKETATRQNTAVETEPAYHTISIPPRSFREWLRQKRRHITTGRYYSKGTRFRLGFEYLTRFGFYATMVALLFVSHWKWVALGAYILMVSVKLVVLKLVMRRLNERDLLLPSLLTEPLMPILLGLMRLANVFRSREPKWN